jgi:hypothetical protein
MIRVAAILDALDVYRGGTIWIGQRAQGLDAHSDDARVTGRSQELRVVLFRRTQCGNSPRARLKQWVTSSA